MEGLASAASVALDFVFLSALVMVRCYIAQCCRALTASEAKREIKAVCYWVERFVMVLIAFQVYALFIDAWSSAASKPILFLFKCGLASSSVGLCFALRACSTCSLVPFLAPSDTVLCQPSAAKHTEQDVDDEFAKDDSSDGPSTADGGDDSDLSDDSSDDDLHDLNLDNKEPDEPLCEANTSMGMPNDKELPPRCPIALIDGNVHLRMLRSPLKKQRLACINEEFRADKPKWLAYLGKLVANELLPRVPVGVKAHSWDNAVEALKQLHEWMQSDDAEHLRQAYKPCLGFRCDCCGSAVRPDEQVCAVCGSLA